jgi:hypothetical protein
MTSQLNVYIVKEGKEFREVFDIGAGPTAKGGETQFQWQGPNRGPDMSPDRIIVWTTHGLDEQDRIRYELHQP